MKYFFILPFIIVSLISFSQFYKTKIDRPQQFPQWGNLTKGKYSVGYRDTLILKKGENFSYFTYNDSKPFFISIWYPAIDDERVQFMKYKAYNSLFEITHCNQIADSLLETFNHILIKDGICKNIKDFEEITFSDSLQKMYFDILETDVCAKAKLVAVDGKFPCIVYHHGAQSTPYDNNVFCEYMASQGFVVVSACYNLPNEKRSKSLITSTDNHFDDISDLQFVIEQTKKMQSIDTNNMTNIGHSMGAQTLIRFDNQMASNNIRKIIALHTTLEDKSMEDAKTYWPELDYLYSNEAKKSTTPVIFFAPLNFRRAIWTDSTGKEIIVRTDTIYPKFTAFKCNKNTPYTFITIKHNVTHDGFISLGNLRFPYCSKYNLSDREEIITQQYFFEQIIRITHEILESNTENLIVPKDMKYNKYIELEFYNQR